jgi:hypothetical protein
MCTNRPYAELTDGYRSYPPIYAQLVTEWRAKGHGVPDRRDVGEVLWASFAAPAPESGGLWPAESWAEDRCERPARRAATEPERDMPDDAVKPVPAVPVPRGLTK